MTDEEKESRIVQVMPVALNNATDEELRRTVLDYLYTTHERKEEQSIIIELFKRLFNEHAL